MKRLKIQLIPETTYGRNVRSEVSPSEWQNISRVIRESTAVEVGGDESTPPRIVYVCEICGEQYPSASSLDAHEVWKFKKKYQVLKDIQAVCTRCHMVIHLGRTIHAGREKDARKWYCKVNNCSKKDFYKAQEKAWSKWYERSRHRWKLDISKLDEIMKEKQQNQNI